MLPQDTIYWNELHRFPMDGSLNNTYPELGKSELFVQIICRI